MKTALSRVVRLALLLIPIASLAASGDFYPGGSTLPGPKADWGPCKNGDTNRCFRALDYNTFRDALNDLRTGVSGSGGMVDGSAAVPALRFTNEATTGMYRAGANDWRFVVASTYRLQLTASGALVHGNATVDGASGLTLSAGPLTLSAGATQAISKTNGALAVGTDGAYSLTLKTNGTTRWTVDSAGNLTASGTPAVSAGSLALNGGNLTLTLAGNQVIGKSGGSLTVGTTDNNGFALETWGITRFTLTAGGYLQSNGTATITNLPNPGASTDVANKGYVDDATDNRFTTTTAQTCTTGTGLQLFQASIHDGGKIRFSGTLFLTGASIVNCVPSVSVSAIYLYAEGGSSLGVIAPAQAYSTGSSTATISVGIAGTTGVVIFHGTMYQASGGSTGTLTCYCAGAGSSKTLQPGSTYSYRVDY